MQTLVITGFHNKTADSAVLKHSGTFNQTFFSNAASQTRWSATTRSFSIMGCVTFQAKNVILK